jgi:hypothetical protein
MDRHLGTAQEARNRNDGRPIAASQATKDDRVGRDTDMWSQDRVSVPSDSVLPSRGVGGRHGVLVILALSSMLVRM